MACFADLPRKYLTKLLEIEIPPEVAENPLMYNENRLRSLSADDVKRLKSARAAFK